MCADAATLNFAIIAAAGAVTLTIPVPLKEDCCGLLDALSATLSVVDREPIAAGVNFIMIVQEELAASVLLQVPPPVFTKSAVFPPAFVTVIEVTELAVVFDSVNETVALDAPTVTVPKF